MSPRPLPRRPAVRAAIFALVLPITLLVAAELEDRPPPIVVSVDGREVVTAARTTFGEAIRANGLDARNGHLLDVEGEVLQRRVDPGVILLNGDDAPRSSRLAEGDAIVVVDGEDRTEGTRRVVERIPGRQLQNPMYTLATSRMQQITTVGRLSGKLVDIEYRSIGGTQRPAAVALTFDDGPWPTGTTRVLDVLERMRVEATFFMVGYLMERYPELVERVDRAGMTIGTHSWAHPYQKAFVDLTPHRIQTEIARPAEFLRRRFGVEPALFRAPGGSYDPYVVRTAREAGMRVVQWSVDPHDYQDGATPAAIAAAVLRSVRPGSIVLLHDGGGDPTATIKALPRIIRGIRAMGLDLVAMDG